MKPDRSLRSVVVAIVGAFVTFCVVGVAIYGTLAHVRVNGFVFSSPAALKAAMGGLFGGGLAALVVLILLLRWR